MATFCLIHGKWHDGSSWGSVPEILRNAGHDVAAPDLPYEDPQTTYAERVAPALAALEHVDDGIVVVGHSLAAAYAPLVAAAHPDSALVHVCPAPTGPFSQSGPPMPATRHGFEFPANRPDGTNAWDPESAIAAMYPRLPTQTATSLAERLRPGASPLDDYPLREPPAVPTTFVYGLYDEFFDPSWSRWVAREVAHVQPIEVETGHFPMLEAPDEIAAILLAAA